MKKKVLVGILAAFGLISVLVINVNAEKNETPAQHSNCRCMVRYPNNCIHKFLGARCAIGFDCSKGGNCNRYREE